jgi:hypothetical protein
MKTEEEKIKALFKKNIIDKIIVDYSAGGDSMNDIYVDSFWKEGKEKTSLKSLEKYKEIIPELTYSNVSFYVNSDGHYMGESGVVNITYNQEEDELEYNKEGQYEYQEHHSEEVQIKLTKEEGEFYSSFINYIFIDETVNGENLDDFSVKFKNNFVLSIKNEKLIRGIIQKYSTALQNTIYEIHCQNEEIANEFFSADNTELEINDNNEYMLYTEVNYYITEYRDE